MYTLKNYGILLTLCLKLGGLNDWGNWDSEIKEFAEMLAKMKEVSPEVFAAAKKFALELLNNISTLKKPKQKELENDIIDDKGIKEDGLEQKETSSNTFTIFWTTIDLWTLTEEQEELLFSNDLENGWLGNFVFDKTELKKSLKLLEKIRDIEIIEQWMDWIQADKVVKEKGGRLPSFDIDNKEVNELSAIFSLKQLSKVMNIEMPQIKELTSYWYWFSTEYNDIGARLLNMDDGNASYEYKDGDWYAVCVVYQ